MSTIFYLRPKYECFRKRMLSMYLYLLRRFTKKMPREETFFKLEYLNIILA